MRKLTQLKTYAIVFEGKVDRGKLIGERKKGKGERGKGKGKGKGKRELNQFLLMHLQKHRNDSSQVEALWHENSGGKVMS